MTPGAAVVAGAGIGGLTTALALSQSGWRVTLVERRTGFSDAGAGIQLSPNASRVLLDLGLGPALRRAATEPDRVIIRAVRSGREIGEVALGAVMRERFEAPYFVVNRVDLQTILLDAVRSQSAVRLLMGRSAVSVDETAARAAVTVQKGGGAAETLNADLVVAADGLRSKMRAAIGDAREPRYRGFSAWRATVSSEAAPEACSGRDTGLWLGRGRHVVHYPMSGGRLINIVAIEPRPKAVEGWSAEGDRDQLLAAFADAADPLRHLLNAPAEWRLWSLFDLPAARMATARVALLGDAAHPVLPFLAQGGALAIEDAAALARALVEGRDVPAALARYADARLRRVRRVQRAARSNGRAYHAGGPAAFVRDRIMKALGPIRMTERYAWVYGWRPG